MRKVYIFEHKTHYGDYLNISHYLKDSVSFFPEGGRALHHHVNFNPVVQFQVTREILP